MGDRAESGYFSSRGVDASSGPIAATAAAGAAYNTSAAALLSNSPPKPASVYLPHIPGVSYRLRRAFKRAGYSIAKEENNASFDAGGGAAGGGGGGAGNSEAIGVGRGNGNDGRCELSPQCRNPNHAIQSQIDASQHQQQQHQQQQLTNGLSRRREAWLN